MNQYFKTIKHFRLKSVFFKSYFLFALVTILFTSLFSVYIYRLYIRNYSQEQAQVMESFLRQTQDRVDDSLQILNESVRSLSQRSEIVQMVILPKKDTTALNFQVTSLLQELVNTSLYFDRIILYESTTGNILQTTSHSDAAGSGLTPLIQYCLDGTNWFLTNVVDHRARSGLVIYGNEIYLAENFIAGSQGEDEFLGTLLVRLSLNSLFRDLSSMLADSPYSLKIQAPDFRTVFQYGETDGARQPQAAVSATSGYSGWTYSLQNIGDTGLSPLRFAGAVFPFLLGFLLIGLMFSFLLALRVYRPLYDMLQTFSEKPESVSAESLPQRQAGSAEPAALPAPGSEYELLTHIYRKARTDRQTAEDFIAQAAPEFERNLLMQLIAQDLTDPDTIRRQLQYIKSPLQMDDCYQCFLLYSDHPVESSHVVNIILQDQAGELAKKTFCPQWGDLRVLRLDSATLLLAVHYSPDLSAARIRTYQNQFCEQLIPQLAELDGHLIFAAGSICPSLAAIHQSYYKAREAIRKNLYYQSDEPSPSDVSSSWASPSGSSPEEGSEAMDTMDKTDRINDQYFQSQMALLDEQFQAGSINQCRNLTAALLREVCFTDDGPQAARTRCSNLFNILIRQTIQPEKEDSPMAHVYQELETIEDPQVLYQFMLKETELLLEKAEILQNSRQYQLVSRAKEYIRQHYTDSALSLQQIADSFSISNTYLSTLFTEYAGESVVSFLNNYRVEAAKDLLINTRIIIKEVGFQTGFNTVQNFNRVFKKITGSTPGDYRKQYTS